MEKPRTRPSAAALFGLTAVLALAITGTAVWRTTGGNLPGIMGKSGQPDPDAPLAMPATGGQPDMRFHMASPWDVAQVPKAVKFDFPAGTESGGFLHGTGADFSGIGGPNTSLGDPVFAVADGQVAFVGEPSPDDGLTVVVHPENNWVKDITVAELKKIWEPEAQNKIKNWNQIRPEWPNKEIHLYGAGVESGTYDYFTEAIVGKSHSSRGDYTASEDDNVLVQGVSTDPNALGFFGFAYYQENKGKLKAVPVNDGDDSNGKGAIMPTVETVKDGSYAPLSRPLFLYVNSKAAARPEVVAFIDFYLDNAAELSREVGYIPLTDAEYKQQKEKFAAFAKGMKQGAAK